MRRKVLLVQPSLQPPGGGNGVAAWVLQALAPHHDVTVLSWWPVDVGPINAFFGTTLRQDDFATRTVPAAWRIGVDHLRVPLALVRSGLLMRYTRRVADGFDVIFGAHNEVDYGRRGIQYIHYPTYVRPRPAVDFRWYHRFPATLRVYYAAADALAGFSLARVRDNLTLVNSDWTGAEVRRHLGMQTQTLYPPVADPAPPWQWTDRHPTGFLAIGRMAPEKDYERIIRILARVRQAHSNLTLTIVTTADRRSSPYHDRVLAAAAAADPDGTWITFRRNIPRSDVQQLIAQHRYGLHGMREEHFGMAPAEMVRGGMIVWVPNGGGQVEIVGDEPLLRFDADDDAVANIRRVITNPAEQDRLRDHLDVRSRRFSTDQFMASVREIVANF